MLSSPGELFVSWWFDPTDQANINQRYAELGLRPEERPRLISSGQIIPGLEPDSLAYRALSTDYTFNDLRQTVSTTVNWIFGAVSVCMIPLGIYSLVTMISGAPVIGLTSAATVLTFWGKTACKVVGFALIYHRD